MSATYPRRPKPRLHLGSTFGQPLALMLESGSAAYVPLPSISATKDGQTTLLLVRSTGRFVSAVSICIILSSFTAGLAASASNLQQLSLPVGEFNLFSSVIDSQNGFAYFGTNTNPCRIIKIRLSDFTRV